MKKPENSLKRSPVEEGRYARTGGSARVSQAFRTIRLISGIVQKLVKVLITQEKLLFELFLQISESIEQLHSAGIGHEDLVPSNLYVSNGNIGFWDLDSCLLFKQETPIKYRIKEYSMFLRTAKTIISNNKNICQNSELLKELTKILTKPLEKISSSAYARLQI